MNGTELWSTDGTEAGTEMVKDIRPGNKRAMVSWKQQPEHYTSYKIERSDDGGQTWQTKNNNPFIYTGANGELTNYLRFADTLDQNNTLYIYRVKGCSPFGLIGPVSDTVHVYGKPDPLPAFPVKMSVAEDTSSGEMVVAWKFPTEYDSLIQGFDVYRSKGLDSLYSKANTTFLTPSTREFTDTNPWATNYYKIIGLDNNNYELSSFPVMGQPENSTPPSAPPSLTGASDENGTVTIKWGRSPEEDVKGYRVYFSNQSTGNFTQATTTWINDTIYRYGLNLNTLSETVYFVVKALDFRENQLEFSPVCAVQRPDIIPPAAPNITMVTAEPGKVHFKWALSSSGDVVEHKFERKPNGAPKWETLLSFDTI